MHKSTLLAFLRHPNPDAPMLEGALYEPYSAFSTHPYVYRTPGRVRPQRPPIGYLGGFDRMLRASVA